MKKPKNILQGIDENLFTSTSNILIKIFVFYRSYKNFTLLVLEYAQYYIRTGVRIKYIYGVIFFNRSTNFAIYF